MTSLPMFCLEINGDCSRNSWAPSRKNQISLSETRIYNISVVSNSCMVWSVNVVYVVDIDISVGAIF